MYPLTTRTQKPTLVDTLGPIEQWSVPQGLPAITDGSHSITTIITCRFLLDLHTLYPYPTWTATARATRKKASSLLQRFNDAAQRAGDAVAEEFGDPVYHQYYHTGQPRTERKGSAELQNVRLQLRAPSRDQGGAEAASAAARVGEVGVRNVERVVGTV